MEDEKQRRALVATHHLCLLLLLSLFFQEHGIKENGAVPERPQAKLRLVWRISHTQTSTHTHARSIVHGDTSRTQHAKLAAFTDPPENV